MWFCYSDWNAWVETPKCRKPLQNCVSPFCVIYIGGCLLYTSAIQISSRVCRGRPPNCVPQNTPFKCCLSKLVSQTLSLKFFLSSLVFQTVSFQECLSRSVSPGVSLNTCFSRLFSQVLSLKTSFCKASLSRLVSPNHSEKKQLAERSHTVFFFFIFYVLQYVGIRVRRNSWARHCFFQMSSPAVLCRGSETILC